MSILKEEEGKWDAACVAESDSATPSGGTDDGRRFFSVPERRFGSSRRLDRPTEPTRPTRPTEPTRPSTTHHHHYHGRRPWYGAKFAAEYEPRILSSAYFPEVTTPYSFYYPVPRFNVIDSCAEATARAQRECFWPMRGYECDRARIDKAILCGDTAACSSEPFAFQEYHRLILIHNNFTTEVFCTQISPCTGLSSHPTRLQEQQSISIGSSSLLQFEARSRGIFGGTTLEVLRYSPHSPLVQGLYMRISSRGRIIYIELLR